MVKVLNDEISSDQSLDEQSHFVLKENNDDNLIDEKWLKNLKKDTKTKVKKRNLDFDNIFEEPSDDYDDYDYPAWTPVGNGRVKILPLTFGKSFEQLYV